MIYITLFNEHSDYSEFINDRSGFTEPNVSLCRQENEMHYTPLIVDPYNGHEYVDLGLPSGTLWATCNIGSETPEGTGLFFAWGETEGYTLDQLTGTATPHRDFVCESYKFSTDCETNEMSKYNDEDNKFLLEPDDDAVVANMGGDWHMPTYEQGEELIKCTTSSVTVMNDVSGVTFTSKLNGNSIFIPAAGYVIYEDYRREAYYNDDNDIFYLLLANRAELFKNSHSLCCWHFEDLSCPEGMRGTMGEAARGVIGNTPKLESVNGINVSEGYTEELTFDWSLCELDGEPCFRAPLEIKMTDKLNSAAMCEAAVVLYSEPLVQIDSRGYTLETNDGGKTWTGFIYSDNNEWSINGLDYDISVHFQLKDEYDVYKEEYSDHAYIIIDNQMSNPENQIIEPPIPEPFPWGAGEIVAPIT